MTEIKSPEISLVIPFHWMPNWQFFMNRCLESIEQQSFKDYEIILTKTGLMASNTNRAIQCARGELIKILYLDDYLAHQDSLQEIVDNFAPEDHWLVTGCLHQQIEGVLEDPHSPHYPKYTEDIHTGNNGIGSPSVLTFRREGALLFDEEMSWLLDCDLYKRYYATYGKPKLLNDLNVVIGIGSHQTTYKLSNQEKSSEYDYLNNKYNA